MLKHNWLQKGNPDFETLMPLAFRRASSTNRDSQVLPSGLEISRRYMG